MQHSQQKMIGLASLA